MSTTDASTDPSLADRKTLQLEERFYDLADDEIEFFKKETGIADADAIKEHIIRIQAEAYAVRAVG